jgi:hypothetical protein
MFFLIAPGHVTEIRAKAQQSRKQSNAFMKKAPEKDYYKCVIRVS